MGSLMHRTRAAISKYWLAPSLILSIFIVIGLAQAAASIWYDKNSPMPAWIQAFGSIAAILASLIAMEQAATVPHWKMDLKGALTWTLVFRTASQFEAALLVARAKNEGHDSAHIVVDGIHGVMHGGLHGMLKAQIACEARYKELTGEDIPQDT